jgi:hypothetical protein
MFDFIEKMKRLQKEVERNEDIVRSCHGRQYIDSIKHQAETTVYCYRDLIEHEAFKVIQLRELTIKENGNI